jgi:hypothetical protein
MINDLSRDFFLLIFASSLFPFFLSMIAPVISAQLS